MAINTQDASDGPVTKPRREPIEKPAPRPKSPGGTTTPPAPPAPRPAPRPEPEPVADEGVDRSPVVKPRKPPKEKPLPTTLSGPINKRWQDLGGMAWGQPLNEPEAIGGGGRSVTFLVGDRRFAVIVWRAATGALLIGATLQPAYARNQGVRGPLGLPTSEELPTHDGVGRYQVFDGGLLVWHPSTGAAAVTGAINAAYVAAGGSGYGYPLAEQAATGDRRAQVQEFRNLDGGGDRSILWTDDHGAHPLYGAIRDAWRNYRGHGSIGYPITGEMDAAGGGRWQRFEGADYLWHPDTGAHEVHGDIATQYHALGGSGWGFPTTDETKAPDGVGRFNHFRGPTGDERSVYWTPTGGAQPVLGLIRQRWSELGWERSHLGYPTGPEVGWPEGGAGALQQTFQGGRFLYRADRNLVAPEPMDFFRDFGGSSELEGWVRVRLFSDGRVEYTGRQRATGKFSYSFGIQAGITNGTIGVANAWEDRVHGTFESGSRAADWSESEVSAAVAASFWDLQDAHLEVTRLKDKSLGWVSGVLEAGLKFLVGSGAGYLLGPAGGMLIVVGTLAATALSGGNVQGGLRVLGGTLWLAGPGGTLIALVAEGVYQLATDERPPNDEEWRVARSVFGAQLPARDDIRITDALGGGERAFVYKRFDGKYTVNMGDGQADAMAMYVDFWRDEEDHSKGAYVRGEKWVHELVHVWQLEHGSNLLLVAQGMAKVFGEDYTYTAGKSFKKYNLEQQAAIVQDWFGRHYTPTLTADDHGLASAAATDDQTDNLWRYVRDNIRSGTESAL